MSKRLDELQRENDELKKAFHEAAVEHCHAYCSDKFMLKVKAKKCGDCFARRWWEMLGDFINTGNRDP